MFRLSTLILAAAFGLSLLPVSAADPSVDGRNPSLDSLLAGDAIFELTPERAEAAFAKPAFMRWLSHDVKERANIKRRPYANISQELTLAGGKVAVEEALLEFSEGKLSKVSFSLWNRGDSAVALTEKAFSAKVAEITTQLDGHFGVKGVDLGLDRSSAAKFKRVQWMTPTLSAQLEYSSSKDGADGFKAEFIRLRVAPPVKVGLGSVERKTVAPTMSRADLATNVQRDSASGETFIKGVPMVDQGMKGYCSVASCQRVFNYYGMPVDEHEMAQVAQTGQGGGTNSKKLAESLDALEGRLKVRFKVLYDLYTNKEMQSMVNDYNRAARKISKPMVTQWYSANLETMNPQALRESRSKGGEYTKFQRHVKDYVDKGIPLLWSLSLGLFPENGKPPMQSGGGHMRLIIGYNFKDPANPQLIFTDSWGAGHEKKTMNLADAFAATHGLNLLEPQQAR